MLLMHRAKQTVLTHTQTHTNTHTTTTANLTAAPAISHQLLHMIHQIISLFMSTNTSHHNMTCLLLLLFLPSFPIIWHNQRNRSCP